MQQPSNTYRFSEGPNNRFNYNYIDLANSFNKLDYPIIDFHSHIHGRVATHIYKDAARLYGVETTVSMTQLPDVPTVKEILGDSINFITMPNFTEKDRLVAHGAGYIKSIDGFRKFGARIVKIWNAPRVFEATDAPFANHPLRLNSPLRLDVMNYAMARGMFFMVHVADPDTWFATKYRDSDRYGTKDQHYQDLEEVVERFPVPWVAAHMGGSPENLERLSNLLARHQNLYIDCSATKWVVRELSKHEPTKVIEFFTRWRGRILFGSDIVTGDGHVTSGDNKTEMAAKASNHDEAFALYASRYWALRTLFETDHCGESPIADPDLHMVDPARFNPNDAPLIRGARLPEGVLKSLYHDTARELLAWRSPDQGVHV